MQRTVSLRENHFINEIAPIYAKRLARCSGCVARYWTGLLYTARSSSTPDPGYGGSRFPKELWTLAKTAQDYEAPVRLIETTIAINDNRKRAMGARLLQPSVRCSGQEGCGTRFYLTFKPNTDDMRDSRQLRLSRPLGCWRYRFWLRSRGHGKCQAYVDIEFARAVQGG